MACNLPIKDLRSFERSCLCKVNFDWVQTWIADWIKNQPWRHTLNLRTVGVEARLGSDRLEREGSWVCELVGLQSELVRRLVHKNQIVSEDQIGNWSWWWSCLWVKVCMKIYCWLCVPESNLHGICSTCCPVYTCPRSESY